MSDLAAGAAQANEAAAGCSSDESPISIRNIGGLRRYGAIDTTSRPSGESRVGVARHSPAYS